MFKFGPTRLFWFDVDVRAGFFESGVITKRVPGWLLKIVMLPFLFEQLSKAIDSLLLIGVPRCCFTTPDQLWDVEEFATIREVGIPLSLA